MTYSKKTIIDKIRYYKINNDIRKAEKFEKMLTENTSKGFYKEKITTLDEVLKLSNIRVLFIRGKKVFYLFADKELFIFTLKLNGKESPSNLSYDEIRNTIQYKRLISLGFESNNGRTYTYKDGKYTVWISMWRSLIKKIMVNGFLVDNTMLRINARKNRNKIIIMKGLTFDDICLMKNKEVFTNKEYEHLHETLQNSES